MTKLKRRNDRQDAAGSLRETPQPETEPASQDQQAVWDAVIASHYLALELRYVVGGSQLPSAASAFAIAQALDDWAGRIGSELRAQSQEGAAGDDEPRR